MFPAIQSVTKSLRLKEIEATAREEAKLQVYQASPNRDVYYCGMPSDMENL